MIITTTSTDSLEAQYLSVFPDQFESEKHKTTNKDYIKKTLDYFANRGYAGYRENRESFVKNYDLLKGVLRASDYVDVPNKETELFIETLSKDLDIPSHIKHYPILNPPINEMIGGFGKKKNTHRAKALDSNSKSEEMEYKTNMMWDLIISQAKQEIMSELEQSGQIEQMEKLKDPNQIKQIQQEIQEELAKKVQEDMIDYTSMAEKWSNHVMEAMRVELNMKEISEEMLKDFLISCRMFSLVDEDNSSRGFSVEEINPKNVTILTTPDKKYSKDAYAVIITQVMEISEIIDKLDLTKDEIDHLRESSGNYATLDNIPSNYGKTSPTGDQSIRYTQYSPLIEQEREIMAAEVSVDGGEEDIRDILNMASPNPGIFGYKYLVTRSYWIGKKLIKKVTYIDENGIEKTVLADENYVNGTIPTEISVEEGWVNQIYKGVKAGTDVYNIKPFNLFPYIPLIGGIFDTKNSPAASLVDLMKPFQILYNIVVNQLYSFLAKDRGKVLKINYRRVPIPKDGDPQDAVDIMLDDAKVRGLILEDDSPENAKGPIQNTQVTNAIDLDLSQSIQTRIQLAQELKLECWELVGFTRQRLASASAGETATANQNSLNISYTQTEPYYIQHRYVLNQLYQAIVDAAQYIESAKPQSTLSYLNSKGEAAFIQVTQQDIKGKDINVYVTSSDEDDEIFRQLQSLSQAVLQNGGTLYDISQLYVTNSVRQLQKILKDLSDKRQQIEDRNIQLQQNQQQIEQQKATAELQQEALEKDKERQFEAWQNELDRINDKEVALIRALGFNDKATEDNNNNGIADALEVTRQQNEVDQANKEHQLSQRQVDVKDRERQDKLLIEMNKLALEREKIKAQIQMKKMDLQNPVVGENKRPAKKK